MHPPLVRLLARVAALAALVGAVSSLPAQWSGVPGINNGIILDSSIYPMEPASVSDGAGGMLVVWRDNRQGNNNSDLYAQRLDANGARLWGDNGAPIATLPGNVDYYDLLADGAGGAFVVWQDQRTINGVETRHLWIQRLDAAGLPLWAANGLLVRADAGPGTSATVGDVLSGDGVGGVYVTSSPNNSAADQTRRLHRLTASGTVAAGWPAEGVNLQMYGHPYRLFSDQPTGTAGEHGLQICMNTGGGSLTVRRASAAGVLSAAVAVPTGAGIYSFQGACPDDAGGMFIVVGINADLIVHRVKADGTFAWPETNRKVVLAGGGANNSGSQPVDLVPDGAGGALVTWCGPSPGTSLLRMAAQRMSPTGDRLWGDNGVEVYPPNNTTYPGTSISDGTGGVIVTWGNSTPSEIRAQRLDASGAVLWSPGGVVVAQPWGLTQIVTDQASGGIYSVVVNNGGGGYSFGAKRTTLTGTLGSNTPSARLANISARAAVGSGGDVLIPGFVVSGGPLQLLVRGVGPTLGGLGVAGVLPDPQLSLVSGGGVTLASNDDWGAAPNLAELTAATSQVFAFGLGAGSKDAALLVTVQPGLYTAVMSSVTPGTTGVGLVELYEIAGPASTGRLANMSVRARVGTGESVLIPGIVVGGTGARSLLVRAVGPTLANFGVAGVLANPTMTLFSGQTAIGTNDNWSTPNGTQVAAIASQVHAFSLPNGSLDAALLVTLAPGLYTAQVSGVGGTTGVCLVEVYEVP